MTQDEELLNKPVLVYYCKCGKSIQCAGDPERINSDRASKKEFKQAKDFGRKVETITLKEFHTIPFLCDGVKDCIDKTNNLKPKQMSKTKEETIREIIMTHSIARGEKIDPQTFEDD